ncbi:SulP family inorganic anion transporter [Candidatus Magnetomonas plexicatena]|uniref:SulP family inorganic anion transporter n=1 Tax=Candidatus Magnetomonas plexicatena TaxID=2552947 RepID=UPI001C78556C|nr:SulP family inorganic anion transporter [Nitrospirales bacterium LBB_01]
MMKTTQTKNDLLIKIFPFLKWIAEVRETWKVDLFAGLTGAVVVLPQGVAFAMIAGMPPQYGLYTAIVPAIVAALFGSSRHLISGPTTAISLVIFSTVSVLAEPGSEHYVSIVLMLTLLAGLLQFGLGIVRLGGLVDFVSHSVVIGFTAGAAILIASSQLKHVFGLQFKNAPHFTENIKLLIENLPNYNLRALIIAAITLVVVIALRISKPKWPGMLVSMVVGGSISYALGWHTQGVRVVGALPSAIPPLSLPNFSFETIHALASPALAVAMLGIMEAVSIARSVALKSGQKIDGNQEFLGQGISNILGSFLSSYASSGSFTRSGVNFTAGAKTPFSAICAAMWLLMILVFVKSLAAFLPIAAMAAVILVVAYNLIDFHHIMHTVKLSKQDAAVMGVTFLATLFLELEFAIYVGALLSIGLYLNKTARPQVLPRVPEPGSARHFITDPFLPQCSQFGIIRIEGDLYFAAMNHVEESINTLTSFVPSQNKILLLCDSINNVDLMGVESMVNLVKDYRKNGREIIFCKMKPEVYTMFKKSGALKTVGEDHVFDSQENAIADIVASLDKNICHQCSHRVFWECDANKNGVCHQQQDMILADA